MTMLVARTFIVLFILNVIIMQYTGKIIFIGNVETVGQNGLQKRTVVLEEITDREFKGGISFDLIKDKVNLIDNFRVGDVINASLNFRTNYSENTQKYYTSISAWKIEAANQSAGQSNDDLPF